MFADHLRFLKEVVPSLASDQVFYEDKTEKESLKQVNRLNCNNLQGSTNCGAFSQHDFIQNFFL